MVSLVELSAFCSIACWLWSNITKVKFIFDLQTFVSKPHVVLTVNLP